MITISRLSLLRPVLYALSLSNASHRYPAFLTRDLYSAPTSSSQHPHPSRSHINFPSLPATGSLVSLHGHAYLSTLSLVSSSTPSYHSPPQVGHVSRPDTINSAKHLCPNVWLHPGTATLTGISHLVLFGHTSGRLSGGGCPGAFGSRRPGGPRSGRHDIWRGGNGGGIGGEMGVGGGTCSSSHMGLSQMVHFRCSRAKLKRGIGWTYVLRKKESLGV